MQDSNRSESKPSRPDTQSRPEFFPSVTNRHLEQFPIDALEAALFEVEVLNASSGALIGGAFTLLVTGGSTSSTTLSTDKGDLAVAPGSEYLLAVTEGSPVVPTSAHTVRLTELERADVSNNWQPIIDAIDSCSYLEDSSSSTISPALTGESGSVSWSTDNTDIEAIENLPTFIWLHNRIEYGMTLEHSSGELSGVLWTKATTTSPTAVGLGTSPHSLSYSADHHERAEAIYFIR